MSFISSSYVISLVHENLLGADFFYDYSYLLFVSRFGLYLPFLGLSILLIIPQSYKLCLRYLSAFIFGLQTFLHVTVFKLLDFSAFIPFYFNISHLDFGFFKSSFGYMIDSLSVFFYLLVPALLLLCVFSSWYILYRIKLLLILLVIMDYTLLNVFLSFDYLHYIVFVELSIIPMFFLIFLWGSRSRSAYSSYVYVFISLLASVFFVTAIIVLVSETGYTSLFYYYDVKLSDYFIPDCSFGLGDITPQPISFRYGTQLLVFGLLFISLAMKMPIFPFHIWLPEAHGEASTVGSVVLAGLFLKMAGFGMFRYLFPFFPDAYHSFKPVGFAVGLLGLFYCSFILFRQLDLKKFIAYSSVVHMNLMVVSMFASSSLAFYGAFYSMIIHSVVASLLFFMAGLIYDRYHTRNVLDLSTLSSRVPSLSSFFYVALLANVAFPLTANFIAEAYMLTGIFQSSPVIGVISAIGVAFTAISHFYLIGRFLQNRTDYNYSLAPRSLNLDQDILDPKPNWDGSNRDMLHLLPLMLLVFDMNLRAGYYLSVFGPNYELPFALSVPPF